MNEDTAAFTSSQHVLAIITNDVAGRIIFANVETTWPKFFRKNRQVTAGNGTSNHFALSQMVSQNRCNWDQADLLAFHTTYVCT